MPVFTVIALLSRFIFQFMPSVDHPIVNELHNAANPLTLVALFLGASVQAPIVEETLFRGTLLPAVSRVLKSPAWGIVITSLIFASIHTTGVPSWLPLASIGAMGALLTYQTRSLLPAMVMHAVHNGAMLAVTLITGY